MAVCHTVNYLKTAVIGTETCLFGRVSWRTRIIVIILWLVRGKHTSHTVLKTVHYGKEKKDAGRSEKRSGHAPQKGFEKNSGW